MAERLQIVLPACPSCGERINAKPYRRKYHPWGAVFYTQCPCGRSSPIDVIGAKPGKRKKVTSREATKS